MTEKERPDIRAEEQEHNQVYESQGIKPDRRNFFTHDTPQFSDVDGRISSIRTSNLELKFQRRVQPFLHCGGSNKGVDPLPSKGESVLRPTATVVLIFCAGTLQAQAPLDTARVLSGVANQVVVLGKKHGDSIWGHAGTASFCQTGRTVTVFKDGAVVDTTTTGHAGMWSVPSSGSGSYTASIAASPATGCSTR